MSKNTPFPPHFKPQAILFDMDGLMIDSESCVLACWQEAAHEHGMTFDLDFLHSLVGIHEKLCYAMLCQRYPEQDMLPLAQMTDSLYAARVEAGLPLKTGIHGLLDYLDGQGLPRAIGTSTKRERAEQNLRATGLGSRFSTLVTASDVAHPKPAPDIYLQAAALLGVAPEHCLVLEDSDPGVRAAFAAGMQAIQVPDMKPPSEQIRALGHPIVANLDEALQLVRKLCQA